MGGMVESHDGRWGKRQELEGEEEEGLELEVRTIGEGERMILGWRVKMKDLREERGERSGMVE